MEAKRKAIKDIAVSELDKLIRKGDFEYDNANYKQALKHYELATSFGRTAALYKKIGMCYYYLDMKEKAIKNLEISLKMNPTDADLEKWLIDYSR